LTVWGEEEEGVKNPRTHSSSSSLRDPLARIRLELGSAAELASPGSADIGYLRAVVSGVRTSLKASTLNGLAELFDDEKEPVVLPMHLDASNIFLTIIVRRLHVHNATFSFLCDMKVCVKLR